MPTTTAALPGMTTSLRRFLPGIPRLHPTPASHACTSHLAPRTAHRPPPTRLYLSPRQGGYGIDMFIAGDQLLKGAALNAVQIAELLLIKD